MAAERTFAMIKPDGVQRPEVVADIVQRILESPLTIKAWKTVTLSKADIAKLYSKHTEKAWYPEMERRMAGKPIIVMILEGPDAIDKWRDLMGANLTAAGDYPQGSIRADFASKSDDDQNTVHGSKDPREARFEIDFMFSPLRA